MASMSHTTTHADYRIENGSSVHFLHRWQVSFSDMSKPPPSTKREEYGLILIAEVIALWGNVSFNVTKVKKNAKTLFSGEIDFTPKKSLVNWNIDIKLVNSKLHWTINFVDGYSTIGGTPGHCSYLGRKVSLAHDAFRFAVENGADQSTIAHEFVHMLGYHVDDYKKGSNKKPNPNINDNEAIGHVGTEVRARYLTDVLQVYNRMVKNVAFSFGGDLQSAGQGKAGSKPAKQGK